MHWCALCADVHIKQSRPPPTKPVAVVPAVAAVFAFPSHRRRRCRCRCRCRPSLSVPLSTVLGIVLVARFYSRPVACSWTQRREGAATLRSTTAAALTPSDKADGRYAQEGRGRPFLPSISLRSLVWVSLHAALLACLLVCLSPCLLVCLSPCLLACWFVCLLASSFGFPRICQPARLSSRTQRVCG
jgi:hypothetical protein